MEGTSAAVQQVKPLLVMPASMLDCRFKYLVIELFTFFKDFFSFECHSY